MGTRTRLNHDWLYCGRHEPAHLAARCDESGFAQVALPHTNCLYPPNGGDPSTFQFVSSYRRHLRFPESLRRQRVFVDFDGAMAVATVFFNGRPVAEHAGGYTPFEADVTELIDWDGDNVLAVRLDSTERPDVPPFGGFIDYLTYGGIYRDVWVRAAAPTRICHVRLLPSGIAAGAPELVVHAKVRNDGPDAFSGRLAVAVALPGGGALEGSLPIELESGLDAVVEFKVPGAERLPLWSPETPILLPVIASLACPAGVTDQLETRFGFRECRFTPEGFQLNGRLIKLRGLNRHQSFPWAGYAMPARVQRRDADILRNDLKLNVVRTSHYPQSPHFLDRCDEIGLLVFEEIPGWQHIGDGAWKERSCADVAAMIARDFNHPSIVLWGVRINESLDDDDFYARTNAIAHDMDPTRQTGGVRYLVESHLLEDVFTLNDFNPVELSEPRHPLHLVTEFCGHMYPTKQVDNVERVTEHARRHAHIQSLAGANPAIAGAIGWCAFDYNTHDDFGAGDGVCHHGVCDMFRMPKPAAAVYRSQCDPAEEVILEPAFAWSMGDLPGGGGVGPALIGSNCDRIEVFLRGVRVATLEPCREEFPGLPHPPFRLHVPPGLGLPDWGDLRLDGFLAGAKVAERRMAASGRSTNLILRADDETLIGDGVDATRVWFMVTDPFGNRKPFATGALTFEIDGPGEIMGDNPFALIGGGGAVWVRAKCAAGPINLRVRHALLGEQVVRIRVEPEPKEIPSF